MKEMKIYRNFDFLLAAILSVFALTGCGQGSVQNQTQGVNYQLNAQEFYQKMQALKESPILDVRTAGEFAGGSIPGAVNKDWNGPDFKATVAKMDKNTPVLVYCLSGGRSSSAASYMRSQGFKEVYELNGGMLGWRSAGLPQTQSKSAAAQMSFEEYTRQVSTGQVLVDFYADWCGPCKKMKPELEELAKEKSGSLTIIRINADENQELANRMEVSGLPKLILYRDHTVVWEKTGYAGKAEISGHLQ